jgi:hypothetical protein
MKLNTIKYILLSSAFLFSGCSKYLDQEPDMRAQINTVDKVKRLVASAYPGRNSLAMAETYSDNVEDKVLAICINRFLLFMSGKILSAMIRILQPLIGIHVMRQLQQLIMHWMLLRRMILALMFCLIRAKHCCSCLLSFYACQLFCKSI